MRLSSCVSPKGTSWHIGRWTASLLSGRERWTPRFRLPVCGATSKTAVPRGSLRDPSLARLASVLAGFSAQQKMNTSSSWKSAIFVYCLRAAWFKPLSARRGCRLQALILRGGSAGNRGIPRRGSAGPRCSRRGPCSRPNRRIAGSCTPSPAPVPAVRRRGGRSRLCRSGQ